MPTLDDSALQRTTRTHFLPELKNNVYSKTRLLAIMQMKGRVKPWTGRSLEWSVVLKKHVAKGLFSGYSTVATQPVNPLIQATLPSANYYATIAISKEELLKNTGNPEKVIDLLKTQMQNAEATLKDDMATDLYASGATIGGLQPLIGLGAVIDTDNTYAGINRSTAGNENWQSNEFTTVYTDEQLQDSTSPGYLPKVMNNRYSSASYDDSPDVIVTTTALYDIYQTIAQVKNLRYDDQIANLGFGGVKFGPANTMIFDRFCTSKKMVFLTTSNFQLFVISGANFDFDEEDGIIWKRPVNQIAKLAHILWMGQLRCDVPRQQAVATALGDG